MAGPTGVGFEVGPAPVLRGETAGEGMPIVLCHGITATRRYVVHGSRMLERAGFRVITYDARGHGESDPAPSGEGYGYPRLVDDLERVIAAEVGSDRFLLGGHSMGAHTVVAYALRHRQRLAERLAGLVVIGPVFRGGEVPDSAHVYWDRLADALERGGVDGFVDFIGREQGTGAAFRDAVLRFTRERMLAHQHLDAVLAALRETPRSRPFEEIGELGEIEVPALVVASHDEADPGHPYKSAVAYAEALPRATLVSEGEGESPLAWQGGKLSRQIASFQESLSSSPLL
ncbi:MAG: alpha/beta fold hydrolase [Actinobacteria bacterium]|nr:alpha/beta fold hydrolase [Actinomycetota bacterium]